MWNRFTSFATAWINSDAPDKKTIEKIELNVNRLESKLANINGKINEYVRGQIFGILHNYSNLVANIPKKAKSKEYKNALQNRITSVQMKLHNVATTKSRGKTLTNHAAVEKAKAYLFETVERMKSDQIAEIDYNNVLEELTTHTQNLAVSRTKLGNKLEDNLCVVFLELFLRSSSVKSTNGAERNVDTGTSNNNQPTSQESRVNDDNKRNKLPGVHGKNISSLRRDDLASDSHSIKNYDNFENFYFGEENAAASIIETSNSCNKRDLLIPEDMARSSKALDNKSQVNKMSDTRIETGGVVSNKVSDKGSTNTCQHFYFGGDGTTNRGNFNIHHQLQLATSEKATSSNTQENKINNGRCNRNALLSNLPKQNDSKNYKSVANINLSYAAVTGGTKTNVSDRNVNQKDTIEWKNQPTVTKGNNCKNEFENTSFDKNLEKDREKTVAKGFRSSSKEASEITNVSASNSHLAQPNDNDSEVNNILSGFMENLNIEDKSNQKEKSNGTGENASCSSKPETSKMPQTNCAISGSKCKYEEINEQSYRRSEQNKKNDDNKSRNSAEFYFEKLLTQIEYELNQCEKSITQIQVPCNSDEISHIKENVCNVLKHKLEKVPENDKTRHMKKVLQDRSMKMITNLTNFDAENRKCIDEALHILSDMEDMLYRYIESNDDFYERKKTFQETMELIIAINVNVSEVNLQKMKVRNKIKHFFIVDAMKYMRELKEKLDRYKVNAKNFAYPRKVDVFKNMTEEISSSEKLLDILPKEEFCIDKRRQFLRHEIKQILEILENKAKFNEEVLSSLGILKEIEEQIDNKKSLPDELCVLKDFNKIREIIGKIGSYNQKLKTRKVEIFSHLHDIEENIYSSIYPQEMCLKKKDLNDLEKSFLEDESGLSKVPQYRDKLSSLKSDAELVMGKLSISKEKNTIFRYNIQLLFEVLKKAREENNFKDECLKKFNENKIIGILRSKFSISYKIRELEELGNEIKPIKEGTNQMDILSLLENMERMIMIERSKLQLQEFNKSFASIRTTISKYSFQTYGFRKNINEIFDMKECVEDMPEGNPELDSLKQAFLKAIFDTLKTLDEKLAGLVMKKKKSENILELHHHFEDFNTTDSSDIDKESVEFVASVRKKAESFEEQVKYYSGTSYSKEYYVIYEKLMLLLEELDELCCEDLAVENATVECMSYIKGLIKQLNTNASSE